MSLIFKKDALENVVLASKINPYISQIPAKQHTTHHLLFNRISSRNALSLDRGINSTLNVALVIKQLKNSFTNSRHF